MRGWTAAALLVALLGASCSRSGTAWRDVEPLYDPATGRLIQLAYDSNRNGIMDTWTEMDGATAVRSFADRNEDGRIDRWEYYDAHARLVKVGFSRQDDGQLDAWAYPGPEGSLDRVELSSSADDARIDRWEFYERVEGRPDPMLTRVEEDTNHDGRPDRWETYHADTLKTVAWDLTADGIPDRRLTYRNGILVSIESDPDGLGVSTGRVDLKQP
jgi:hypothetical protein